MAEDAAADIIPLPLQTMRVGYYHTDDFKLQLNFSPGSSAVYDTMGPEGGIYFGTYTLNEDGGKVLLRWNTLKRVGSSKLPEGEDVDLSEEADVVEGGLGVVFKGQVFKHQSLTGWQDD